MSKAPTPKADALRAMREANYAESAGKKPKPVNRGRVLAKLRKKVAK